jgi:hypothetical protein
VNTHFSAIFLFTELVSLKLLDESVSPPCPEYPGKKSESPAVAGPLCLEELAARAVIATRRNFYSVRSLAPRIKDYLTQIAQQIEATSLTFHKKIRRKYMYMYCEVNWYDII